MELNMGQCGTPERKRVQAKKREYLRQVGFKYPGGTNLVMPGGTSETIERSLFNYKQWGVDIRKHTTYMAEIERDYAKYLKGFVKRNCRSRMIKVYKGDVFGLIHCSEILYDKNIIFSGVVELDTPGTFLDKQMRNPWEVDNKYQTIKKLMRDGTSLIVAYGARRNGGGRGVLASYRHMAHYYGYKSKRIYFGGTNKKSHMVMMIFVKKSCCH